MPRLCFPSLEFPERQKALKVTPVKESETREIWQIAQGHTANHKQLVGWAAGFLKPRPVLSPLPTLPSIIMGT